MPSLAVGIVAADDRQQTYPAQPVQRMPMGAVTQAEPGLCQGTSEVTG
jgi:hypothetical protein